MCMKAVYVIFAHAPEISSIVGGGAAIGNNIISALMSYEYLYLDNFVVHHARRDWSSTSDEGKLSSQASWLGCPFVKPWGLVCMLMRR